VIRLELIESTRAVIDGVGVDTAVRCRFTVRAGPL
jgi:hypothetical protein